MKLSIYQVDAFEIEPITPYWSKKLKKTKLHAFQVSKRGGELFCEDLGSRVKISGRAVFYLKGEIEI